MVKRPSGPPARGGKPLAGFPFLPHCTMTRLIERALVSTAKLLYAAFIVYLWFWLFLPFSAE